MFLYEPEEGRLSPLGIFFGTWHWVINNIYGTVQRPAMKRKLQVRNRIINIVDVILFPCAAKGLKFCEVVYMLLQRPLQTRNIEVALPTRFKSTQRRHYILPSNSRTLCHMSTFPASSHSSYVHQSQQHTIHYQPVLEVPAVLASYPRIFSATY